MDKKAARRGGGRKLQYWQTVVRRDEDVWQSTRDNMRRQEQLLRGTAAITAPDGSILLRLRYAEA